MLMAVLVHSAAANTPECSRELGYSGNFDGVVSADGACQLDAEPSGTFADAWGTPERAEAEGTWNECQEGGSQVITIRVRGMKEDEYRHTWRYDERGILTGECDNSPVWGDYACCDGTGTWPTSHWRVGTLEECTPVPVPEEGCDHSASLGSSSALALALAALLRRGASADARRTGPC